MGFYWSLNISLEYCVPIDDVESYSLWYLLRNLALWDYRTDGFEMFLLGSGAASSRAKLHAPKDGWSRRLRGSTRPCNQLPILYKPDVLKMIRTFLVDKKASVRGPKCPAIELWDRCLPVSFDEPQCKELLGSSFDQATFDAWAKDTAGKVLREPIEAALEATGAAEEWREVMVVPPKREELTDIEKRFHFNKAFMSYSAPYVALPWDHDTAVDNLYCGPAILAEAFVLAADKILGVGHGLSIRIMKGGCYGQHDPKASGCELIIFHEASEVYPAVTGPGGQDDEGYRAEDGTGGVSYGRGGTNAAWGVQLTDLPTSAPAGTEENIKTLLRTFNIKISQAPAWRLVTHGDGG